MAIRSTWSLHRDIGLVLTCVESESYMHGLKFIALRLCPFVTELMLWCRFLTLIMCSAIINLSERGLATLDYSYETATAIILDKNDIRDINTISFMTNVQQLSIANNLLKDMYGLENFTHITILNLAYNEISRIEHLGSLTHLTWLNLCGNRIKKIAKLSHNLALKHLDLSENEIERLGDLSNLLKLKTLLLHCNRIASLKRAEKFLPHSLCILSLAENDIPTLTEFKSLVHCGSLLQLSIQGNLCAFNQYPFVWSFLVIINLVGFNYHIKQSHDSADRATPRDVSAVPEELCSNAAPLQQMAPLCLLLVAARLQDGCNGLAVLRTLRRLPLSPPLRAWLTRSTVLGAPHILRSDSIFVPIDSDVELEEAEAEVTVQSPKNVARIVSVDLPVDCHLHSESGPTRKPSSVSDVEMKGSSSMLPNHRLRFSRGALASLLHHRPCITEGPAINMMSEKADHRSNEGASETCSPLSEHTFVVDPPFESTRSPEGLEAKILALRRQLEELRVLSANQERERLRQAGAIRRLAEEVRSLKAWKASVLQRQEAYHPAAGDSIHHKFQSVADPDSAPQRVWSVHTSSASPSLSTLVAINTSSTTNATANVSALTVCDVEGQESEEDEEEEESPTDDSDDGGDEVEDFPEPRASSSDMNGTLLTANISTDSLDTRRSRTSTPMGFGTLSTYLGNNCQLASESILLPTDANSST
ncbi:Centrosomal protein [Echinococcus granulosus]|uniref:Centrosomal protein n=1 Tax=Echinococcus granulosus TaxID=6210 RepID=W6UEG4_ECHGR|nr:Centrosomal protein [Echinococcus granulosus]EUB59438.1 Centrosomal protein [Echinococcus granulosus]